MSTKYIYLYLKDFEEPSFNPCKEIYYGRLLSTSMVFD